MNSNIKPGRWLYGLAVFILIAGVVSFIALLVMNIVSMTGGYKQVVVPGKQELSLTKAGKYVIYYEYESVVEDKVYSTSNVDISGLKCLVTDKSTNTAIQLSPANANSTYTIGGRQGKSEFEFNIDKPGTYEISAWYENEADEPKIVLAVGQGFVTKILVMVFGGMAIMFGTIVTAVLIFILTFIKRRKYKKQLELSLANQAASGYPNNPLS